MSTPKVGCDGKQCPDGTCFECSFAAGRINADGYTVADELRSIKYEQRLRNEQVQAEDEAQGGWQDE